MNARFGRQWMAIIILGTLLPPLSQAQDVRTVEHVEMSRYVGQWYEIARLPNRFQKDCVANVTAQYTARPDGDLDVLNQCERAGGKRHQAAGRARMVDPHSHAKLKIRFAPEWLSWLPFVWEDYWILALADGYSYAAVGDPSRQYLWILSRAPTLPDDVYDTLLNRLTAQGFDTASLVKTRQSQHQTTN